MFPDTDVDIIKRLMEQKMSTTEIIDFLLQEKEDTPSSILSQHAQKVISLHDELVVKVNRAVIFSKAKALCKGAVHNPSILHKSIIVEFSGEEGADAGALRNDFFEESLRQANVTFFEGQEGRRIPRYHWGSQEELEIVG